jgi:thiol-disulfide isomerase/thioredoxin
MLAEIPNKAYSLMTNSRFWIILLAIIFFLFLAGYVYNTYVASMINKDFIANNEFPKDTDSGGDGGDSKPDVIIYIFTVTWCPHSKKAIPVWNELKEKYNNKKINGQQISFIEVDSEENPDLADKYKVEGYPTIKLIKGNQIIEYDAKPSKEHLEEFLQSTLG